VGSAHDRADRICRDAKRLGSEGAVISRIPGASHCALESGVIAGILSSRLRIPVVEIEVPPVSDALAGTLRTRLQALVETVKRKRTV
jgi:benzoyl-CoA reductase/2-hydroxyglutaryl-CoA dehydratase subunit BcrC/BadD/HgdB